MTGVELSAGFMRRVRYCYVAERYQEIQRRSCKEAEMMRRGCRVLVILKVADQKVGI